MASVFDKRLVFVTGKGGVGKSTVATALGLAAARRGKRVIICEVAQQDRVSRIFRRAGEGEPRASFEETELAPGLAAISIDPQRALEDYLRAQVGSRTLSRLLFESRIFQYLAAAAPGVKELVTMGKVWELAQLDRPWTSKTTRYDLVVVDAPATGHGLALLRTPRTIRDIARVGPIRRQADRIDTFVRDPARTAVVAVAVAEEMPVAETLDLRARLDTEMGLELEAVVVNGLYPERFTAADARALAAADGAKRADPVTRAALRAAISQHRRARAQRTQLRQLRRQADGVVTLPHLFQPELGLPDIERLSRELDRRL